MSSHTAAIARRSTRAKITNERRFQTKYQAAPTAAMQIMTNNRRPTKFAQSEGLRTRRITNPSLRCPRFLELHLHRQETQQVLQRQNSDQPIALQHQQARASAAIHSAQCINGVGVSSDTVFRRAAGGD